MQPVRNFDHDHADIFSHSKEHLAQILDLRLLLAHIRQARQLGNALHNIRDRLAEHRLDLRIIKPGILDAVVKQRRHDRINIQPHFRNDLRHRDRVRDIIAAVAPLLPIVRPRRLNQRQMHLAAVRLGQIAVHLLHQFLIT